MSNRYAVIMAGGRGERFWPKSRLKTPKHLLPIVGDKPMLQQTIERLEGVISQDNIFVITSEHQQDGVKECCPGLKVENIISEPVGRDTAAVVGLATILVKQRDSTGVFVMLPADQVIHDVETFQKTLTMSFDLAASEEVLVTLGIKPTTPATGYGYIKKGAPHTQLNGESIYHVDAFVEKPDLATAQQYLDSGEYFWNAGMFVWGVATIEQQFKEKTPDLYKSLQEIELRCLEGEALSTVLAEVYPSIQKISIDYAIMEKASNVLTVESLFDWDDVGAWPALERHMDPDASGNIIQGDVTFEESEDNIIIGEKGHLTALIGVKDLIVVQTGDVTLICPKGRDQEIKQLVAKIAENPDYKHLL